MNRPGPVVEIMWTDITGLNGWHKPMEAHAQRSEGTALTIGYLMAEDDDGVLICQSIGAWGQVGESMNIPRASVTSVRRLEEQPDADPT